MRGALLAGAVCSVAAALVAWGCTDLSGVSGGEEPDASDGGGSDGPITPAGGEGGDGSTGPSSDGSASGCPSGRGPTMVRIGDSFCIDSTEVTQSQYLAFTQSKAGDTSGQPTACAANGNFGAGCGFNPSLKPDHPVEAVDWCDAFAYCKWAGKRLCGKPDNAETQAPALIAQSGANAWYAACTGGGSLAYPYGEFYDASACNGGDAPGSEAVPVGSMASCAGGYPGLSDMTGNVFEWVDFCSAAPDGGPPSDDRCYVMGGNYQQSKDAQRCAYSNDYARSYSFCGFGFRCCADLP